ncbi:hypothetical protein DINM_003248 [Dirofilaria immitis]|nr:hypothetical protein [Dirofilaria immitis]
MSTTPGIPRPSPIQVLTRPNVANLTDRTRCRAFNVNKLSRQYSKPFPIQLLTNPDWMRYNGDIVHSSSYNLHVLEHPASTRQHKMRLFQAAAWSKHSAL